MLNKQKEVNVPFKEVMTRHFPLLVLGTIAAICTFVVFYLTTVFALNWGTTQLGYARGDFLGLQLIATLCFAAFIPLSAIFAEKFGRHLPPGLRPPFTQPPSPRSSHSDPAPTFV